MKLIFERNELRKLTIKQVQNICLKADKIGVTEFEDETGNVVIL